MMGFYSICGIANMDTTTCRNGIHSLRGPIMNDCCVIVFFLFQYCCYLVQLPFRNGDGPPCCITS